MPLVDRFLDLVASLFKGLATVCLAAMVSLNIFNVVWRAVLDQAFGWIFEWTLLLFVWMTLFGFYAYVRARADVVVDVVVTRLPRPLRRVAGLWVAVVGMAAMLVILRAGPDLLAMQTASMEGIALPIWVRSGPLFLAAGLVFLHYLNLFVATLSGRIDAFARSAGTGPAGVSE